MYVACFNWHFNYEDGSITNLSLQYQLIVIDPVMTVEAILSRSFF